MNWDLTWDIISTAAAWAGAIGVIATLFYLAQQIKQHRIEMSRQMEQDLNTRAFAAFDPVYEGRNAEIMYTGLQTPEQLSDVDAYIFDLMMARQSGVIGAIALRLHQGELPRKVAKIYADHYQDALFSRPGGKAWFDEKGGEAYEVMRSIAAEG